MIFQWVKVGFQWSSIWRFEQASSLGWDGEYVKQLKQIESTMGQKICEYHPCTSPLRGAVSQQDTVAGTPNQCLLMSTDVVPCGTPHQTTQPEFINQTLVGSSWSFSTRGISLKLRGY